MMHTHIQYVAIKDQSGCFLFDGTIFLLCGGTGSEMRAHCQHKCSSFIYMYVELARLELLDAIAFCHAENV
mgnify:CR=1 FL=1